MRAPILLLAVLLLPAAAAAVDTWEPYPLGPSALEAYVTFYGITSGEAEGEGNFIVFGPSWGITERSHVSLFLGLQDPEKGKPFLGGLQMLSLVYFLNLYDGGDGPFHMDVWYQATALGDGLANAGCTVGLELNLDQPDKGLFFRPSRVISQTMDEGDLGVLEHYSTLWTAGGWLSMGRGQFLAELTGAENDDERLNTSYALGINHPWGETLELIGEWRYWPGPEDADEAFWDITFGFVAVW